MNVAKIIRRALVDSNVIRIDNTTPSILEQSELLSWVEEGTDILEKALRNARVDYMIVTRQTSDSAFIWDGETYTPNSTSTMSLISTTTEYIMPPDLLRLRRIRSVSTGDEDIEFEAKDIAHQDMIDLQQATNPQRQILYFDLIGDRILFIPNAPTGTISVEISYIARSRKPYIETGGTDVGVVQADATVTGNGTSWLINERYYPSELMLESSGGTSSPVVVSQTSTDDFINMDTRTWPLTIQVYPGVPIASDTTFELATPYSPATDANIGYMLASVPLPPSEHHHIIVDFVHGKIKNRLQMYTAADIAFKSMREKIGQFRQDITPRQSMQHRVVDDYEVF